MATNNLKQYLEKKYNAKGAKEILIKFDLQKAKYVQQGKK